jgi:hypothetical protein
MGRARAVVGFVAALRVLEFVAPNLHNPAGRGVLAALAVAVRHAKAKPIEANEPRCRDRRRAAYCCPAIAHMGRCRAVVGFVAALRFWEAAQGVRVLTRGIDTLHLYTLAAVETGELEGLQESARADKTPRKVVLAGVELMLQPYRLRAALVLKNDFFTVRVDREAVEPHPTVVVEISAHGLWSLGWRAAGEKAEALMRELAKRGQHLDTQVSRVDVCADFHGWQPTPEDRRLFSCRAKRRARFFEGEAVDETPAGLNYQVRSIEKLLQAVKGARSKREKVELLQLIQRGAHSDTQAEYDGGKHFTGFAFGFGRSVSARLYDKTREIVVSRKGWVRGIYRHDSKDDFQEDETVMRLEFQLRRQALREYRVSDEGSKTDISTWSTLRDVLPELWRTLTTRWLRHGSRWASKRDVLSSQWAQLSKAFELEARSEARPRLHREAIESSLQTVVPALAGYLTSAAAQLNEVRGTVQSRAQFSAAITQVLAAAHDYVQKKTQGTESLETRAAEKAESYAARRRVLRLQGDGHRSPRWETHESLNAVDAEWVSETKQLGGHRFASIEKRSQYNAGQWHETFHAVPMDKRESGH